MTTITVTLSAESAAWLKARVAAGDYATLEEGVVAAVDTLEAEWEEEEPILPGSKLHALLTEGIESADRGELIDAEEFMTAWIARLSEEPVPAGVSR